MHKIRVLLVDDDKSFREPMKGWLESKGFQVDAVADGESAIRQVRQTGRRYDVALIDQILVDGRDGIEVMNEIHRDFPDLQVIIVTGWSDKESGLRALREGAYRYIGKPTDPDEIEILINNIAELREMRRRLKHTEKEKDWLDKLLTATQAMQRHMHNKEEVFEIIAGAARTLTDADGSTIWVWDRFRNRYSYARISGFETLSPAFRRALKPLGEKILADSRPRYTPRTDKDPHIKPPIRREKVQSLLGVPIGSLGVLYVFGRQEDQFGKKAGNLLEMLASQAALAIRNMTLLEEKGQRVKELEKLRDVGKLMAEAVDLKEALQQIIEGVKILLKADSVVVRPVDASRRRFVNERMAYWGIPGESLKFINGESMSGGIAQQIMDKNFLFIHDVNDPQYDFIGPSSRSLYHHTGIKCFVGIKLEGEEEMVGILYVNFNKRREFSAEQWARLEAFVPEAALAIKKARLYRLKRKALQYMEKTSDFMVVGNIEEVLKGVTKGAKEALQCDSVILYRYDQDKGIIDGPPVTSGLQDEKLAKITHKVSPQGTLGNILREREHYADDAPGDEFMSGEFTRREKVRSSAGIALRVQDRTLGLLFVNYLTPHHFSEDDKHLINMFAAQAAIAIRNVELFAVEKRWREHLESLYEAGKEITAALQKDDIFNTLLNKALDITEIAGERALFGNIMDHDADAEQLVFTHAQPPEILGDIKEKIGHRIDLRNGHGGKIGLNGKAVKLRATQWIQNVKDDPQYIPYHPRTQSEIVAPLIVDDRVIATLNVEHADSDGLDKYDKMALEMLATQAAVAIQKAEQFEKSKQTERMLASRTALAFMGIASTTWRHSVNKYAAIISDNVWLLRQTIFQSLFMVHPRKRRQAKEYLQHIEEIVQQLGLNPINAPLSADEEVECLDINAFVKEHISRMLEAGPTSLVTAEWAINPAGTITVRISKEWLREALKIVVQNALEAMHSISSKRLLVKTNCYGREVEISIRDNGRGIPPEIQDKLLQDPIPKKSGEAGSGIGLLLAQHIVQTYNGNIRVVSSGPEGTEIAISLPLENSSDSFEKISQPSQLNDGAPAHERHQNSVGG